MITAVWTGLALTGLYPHLLPTAAAEPRPGASLGPRLAVTAVGLAGLALWAASMVTLKKQRVLAGAPLKGLTFFGALNRTLITTLPPPHPNPNPKGAHILRRGLLGIPRRAVCCALAGRRAAVGGGGPRALRVGT